MFKRAFYSTLALLLAAPALAKVEAVDGYVRLLPRVHPTPLPSWCSRMTGTSRWP